MAKKYIDAEKLEESLKRRYTDITVPVITSKGGLESYYRRREIRDIIKLIDSLQQEQPEVDLEEEADRLFFSLGWYEGDHDQPMLDCISLEEFRGIARHFYELGLKAKEENK